MPQWKKEFKPASAAMLDQAAWTFRRSERIRSVLHFLKKEPNSEFIIRTEEFDSITREMNRMMAVGTIDRNHFASLQLLKEHLEGKQIPQLFDLSLKRQIRKITGKGNATLADAIDTTFADVGQWTWPEEVTDNMQLASGVLIEGFGRLMEKMTGLDGIQRTFVLAFEEVGINKAQNTKIMGDVLPWLIEEKAAFSSGTQETIESLTP